MLTITDGYAGWGGSMTGAESVPGIRGRYALNHWALAIATHNANFPHVDHDQVDLTDEHDGDPRKYEPTDLLWMSPECFPAGTTVLTGRGVVAIEDVRVGDSVLTHRLRWRPVTAVMSKVADTVRVAGYGHAGLEVTTDHPFYARSVERVWQNDIRQYRRAYGDAGWVRAGDLTPPGPGSSKGSPGHMWGSPTHFGETVPPPVLEAKTQSRLRPVVFNREFWWLVGRWLGDGCLRLARGEVQVTCGLHEADELGRRLRAMPGLRWSRRNLRTAAVFITGHIALADWLRHHFGEHAHGKTMPAWALGMALDWRIALLEGYTSADGGIAHMSGQRPQMVCTTVSRRLAVGVRLLALSLGWKAGMSVGRRTSGVIEGRRVTMRPLWRVQWCIDPSATHDQTNLDAGIRWAPVRCTTEGRRGVKVFNLSVADDESYVADGLIVHNCTTWSQARGQTRDYDVKQLDLLEEEPEVAEAVARSRFQMETVLIFARCHPYKGIVVENVPDILKWSGLDTWLAHLHRLGYLHKTVTLNSAFAHQLGAPAPQLRDRVYFVFWQARYTRPDFDKWLRPDAWCPTCDQVVRAVKVDKPGVRRPMRYNSQYYYRCPAASCRNAVVHPLILPARAAIDWSIVGERIGDRKKPLASATRRRIAAGLARYAQPIHLEVAGNTFERRPGVRSWPVDEPYRTFHTTQSRAVAGPPLMVPTGGTWNDDAATADGPLRTRTTREAEAVVCPPFVTVLRSGRPRNLDPQADPMATVVANGSGHALVVPTESRDAQRARGVDEPLRTQTARHTDALVVPLRNNGVARPAAEHPLPTVAAAGTHHALVMRNNNSRGDGQGHMCTPTGEPLRTLTTAGHQSLLEWGTPPGALYAYDTGLMRPLGLPMPTQTSTVGDALLTPGQAELAVDDCWLRMLTVREIAAGMAFRPGFLMPYGSKRDQVRGCGNAVTPPAARDILAMLAEAVTGDPIDPVGRFVAA